jgi:LmbE family N-acetylglucosaminyl deacetylase
MSEKFPQHLAPHFIGQERPGPLRVLILGAHPDDPDFTAGGVAALYCQQGHVVKMVSLTDGSGGHHAMAPRDLARRRRAEAAEAGRRLGAEYITLDNADGELLPTLEARNELVRLIRQFQPDLVMGPRPYDYHPDHRYTSQLMQDAVCIASVPNNVRDVPHLLFTPVVVYVFDSFQKPRPFEADVVVSIDAVAEKKIDALDSHVSQMYEFLPYIKHRQAGLPEAPAERRAWLRQAQDEPMRQIADRFRERLIALYGEAAGQNVQYAEAFEACEYGAPLTDQNLKRLFPFFD